MASNSNPKANGQDVDGIAPKTPKAAKNAIKRLALQHEEDRGPYKRLRRAKDSVTSASTSVDPMSSTRPQSSRNTARAREAAAGNTSDTQAQPTPANILAGIETQIVEMEKSPSKPRFHWLQQLIDATKQLPLDDWVTDQIEPVKFGEDLLEDQVNVAISAITESFQRDHEYYDEKGIRRKNLYSLMSTSTLTNAKFRPVPLDCLERARVARPRGILMFPWVYDPVECANRTTSHEVKKATKKKKKHLFLVTVDCCKNRLDIPIVVIHDSAPKYLQTNEHLWKFIQTDIAMTISNFGMLNYPEVVHVPPNSSIALLRTEAVQASRQTNEWACGVHVILNAWAKAMCFPIHPGCKLDNHAYGMAVEIINLAMDGRASSKMIAVFLVETGFVRYKLGQRHRPLRRGRINKYHNFRSWVDLDEQILAERMMIKKQMDDLRRSQALDHTLIMFDKKENVGVAEANQEDQLLISPSVRKFFHNKFSDLRAKSEIDLIYESLQGGGLIKKRSSGEPSQRSKVMFLSKLLSSVAEGPAEGYDQENHYDILLALYMSHLERPDNSTLDQDREK